MIFGYLCGVTLKYCLDNQPYFINKTENYKLVHKCRKAYHLYNCITSKTKQEIKINQTIQH